MSQFWCFRVQFRLWLLAFSGRVLLPGGKEGAVRGPGQAEHLQLGPWAVLCYVDHMEGGGTVVVI